MRSISPCATTQHKFKYHMREENPVDVSASAKTCLAPESAPNITKRFRGNTTAGLQVNRVQSKTFQMSPQKNQILVSAVQDSATQESTRITRGSYADASRFPRYSRHGVCPSHTGSLVFVRSRSTWIQASRCPHQAGISELVLERRPCRRSRSKVVRATS